MVARPDDLTRRLERALDAVIGDKAELDVATGSQAGLAEFTIRPRNSRAASIWIAADEEAATVRIADGSRLEVKLREKVSDTEDFSELAGIVGTVAKYGFVETVQYLGRHAIGYRGELRQGQAPPLVIRTNWYGPWWPFKRAEQRVYDAY